ncbi:MAG: peptide-methionine (R)-S-oxide reductase [Bacteroidetes bacterium]|nr:MAG: peptide-methionine (R)-S-oxide reductase [Bacteroidota bacterium]
MKKLILYTVFLIFYSSNSTAQQQKEQKVFPVTKSDTEWKAQLSDLEYYVLREAGTERQFSSALNNNYNKGTYICVACKTPLFESDYKYDSKSGWPSFDREIKNNVAFSTDYDLGFAYTEEHCATCGSHLGHVFNDGPKNTTGKRHCINGVALKFVSKKNE